MRLKNGTRRKERGVCSLVPNSAKGSRGKKGDNGLARIQCQWRRILSLVPKKAWRAGGAGGITRL
jgi:hypothetical protein